MEANSTVNLVPFGLGITELRMREDSDFVVPVNILTPFARAPFSWAARHTTVCLDKLHKTRTIFSHVSGKLQTRSILNQYLPRFNIKRVPIAVRYEWSKR